MLYVDYHGNNMQIFNYCQQQVNWKVIKPMAQYALVLDSMSVYTEGVWIRRVSVSSTMDWLIGISGCDVLIYAFNATLLLHMKRLKMIFSKLVIGKLLLQTTPSSCDQLFIPAIIKVFCDLF